MPSKGWFLSDLYHRIRYLVGRRRPRIFSVPLTFIFWHQTTESTIIPLPQLLPLVLRIFADMCLLRCQVMSRINLGYTASLPVAEYQSIYFKCSRRSLRLSIDPSVVVITPGAISFRRLLPCRCPFRLSQIRPVPRCCTTVFCWQCLRCRQKSLSS